MTEQEWLDSTDPLPMVDHLGDKLAGRKLRLLACASARLSWKLLDEDSRAPVEVAERFADGLATPEALLFAFRAADTTWASIPDYVGSRRAMRRSTKGREAAKTAAWVARNAANPDLHVRHVRYHSWGRGKGRVSQADLLRDLFGTLPFRPVAIDPAWLAWNGGAVRGLAENVEEDGTFDLLPVLGDALEDAGCSETAILDHLRGEGHHVRGCWAVDLILGKQ